LSIKINAKEKRERRGRIPATDENMILPPGKVVTFKCYGKLWRMDFSRFGTDIVVTPEVSSILAGAAMTAIVRAVAYRSIRRL